MTPLPAYLDWLGWAVAAVIILTNVYLFYRQRKKKYNDPRTMWMHGIDGFASVWIPNDVEKPAGEKIAARLENVRDVIWKQCLRNYGEQARWTIAQINVADAEPHKDHKHVMLIPAAHKIYLRLQEGMYYWFARECHNVYRWQLHGFNFIYEPKDDADKSALILTQDWIEGKWGNRNG